MSKVMRAIDAKSFIIGVLSAVIVCMVMGASATQEGWDTQQEWQIISVTGYGASIEMVGREGMEPFAVTDETKGSGKMVYFRYPKK
jgi:hypothetical protein